MSDNEDDEAVAPEQQQQPQDENTLTHNPIEYIDDACERNENHWLVFPAEFIRPARMCSVNKYVQCVDVSFIQHSVHHIPNGPEYVLVGHDSPSLPTHMFKWIWAMSQINLMKQYSGCVVPVAGVTEVTYAKRGKGLIATNIKRQLVIPAAWQLDENMQYEKWFNGMRQETVLMESVQELRNGNSHFADVPVLQFLWGIIPVEYTLNGTKVRRIFHTLKTIPAPGFDLMRCLVDLQRRGDQKMSNGVPYAKILQTVQDVINYECNCNLRITGFFGRSHPLPHPMQVMDDPASPMNPQAILSPFMVVRKMLLQMPVSELEGLVIDGFPKTDTPAQREMCFTFYKDLQVLYRSRLRMYHRNFDEALKASTKNSIESVELPRVLCSAFNEILDHCYSKMNMTFNLNKWLDGGTACLDRAELLRLPQLAVATLTPFQYVTLCDSTSPAEFIRAHIGDAGEELDETRLGNKYSADNGSWGDIPHAGMFKSSRESIKTSLKTMPVDDCEGRIHTYNSYLRAQSTIHTQSVLVDLMMSDRVLHSAQCLDRLSARINEAIHSAFNAEVPGNTARAQRNMFAAYPDSAYYLKLLHTLSLHNKHIRANAVNLTTLWAIMVSDVLTHLGAHHETWNWMMYTVQVMGGAGHLRAQTDDHGSRTQVIFTSKPNSVGFNAVITKTFKAFSTLVTELLPDLSSDFIEPLRFMKLDRTTRSGVEAVSAVMFVNGVRELAPDRKNFMRPIIMDEGYRSMDAAALNGMVCSIPRDSDGGSGNILKAVENKAGGAHLQGHQRQIPGLSPFLLAMTSNSNPHTAVIGECIKTFSVVTAMFPAGAQPGGKLSSIQAGKKRKISEYQASNTNAASTLPSCKSEREDLAWIMCVLQMATRQLALINKTGQVLFEINQLCRAFVDWVRNIIQQHFQSFFSSMLLLSYDRVIAGFLTRQVATTFMATCARHYAECSSVTEANARVLRDMETAPITLQACNVAICNAITHLTDSNLLLVNQMIREKLKTPVVSIEFMLAVMSEETVTMDSGHYDAVFTWVSQMVQGRQHDAECMLGYVAVPKLGTAEDYSNKEAYLESYFGVAKNNFYTYITAIRECCSKTFDLSGFLSMDSTSTDFTRFIGRMGVGGDGLLAANQRQQDNGNGRCTYMFMQNANEAGPGGARNANGNNKCWVNIIQHLFITALQGNHELHADNIFTFGANLTELILSRCAPVQSSPARYLVLESYRHVHEEVVPHSINTTSRPDYFVRAIQDHGAIETGRSSELPAMIGAHPPEDIMHLASWLQLYTILYNGSKPDDFQTFPNYNGRPPELVMGRRYPFMCAAQTTIGTVLLSPGSARFTISKSEGEWDTYNIPLEDWWSHLQQEGCMVAPLIFRKHAAIAGSNHKIWTVICDDEGQFIDECAQYTLWEGSPQTVGKEVFITVHQRLVPIGSHIKIKNEAMNHFGITISDSNAEWIIACLRYPDGPVPEQEDRTKQTLYAIVRVKTSAAEGAALELRLIHAAVEECRMPSERETNSRMSEVENRDLVSILVPS